MTQANITIMGCGNSTGVPAIGNYWGACDPSEPKNTRTRCSIALQSDETTLVIDAGPDLRTQSNAAGLSTIDALLFTHHHSDHVNGIDELRVIKHRSQKELMDVFMDNNTHQDLKTRFHYLFDGGKTNLYPPILNPNIFEQKDFGHEQGFRDFKFTPFLQDHGTCNSVGYRFGDTAYSVDIYTLDDQAIQTLQGVSTWIVDAAGYKNDNPVHASLDTILALNKRIGAARVILTSLSLAMDYQTLIDELPEGYEPAYDGMRLTCNF